MKSAALRHPARLAGASLLRLQSDARLTELAAAGHEAAFDAIVDRYRTPLMRYCAGIVGPSRAEDAVQQTLINAHEAMTRTDEVRHLKLLAVPDRAQRVAERAAHGEGRRAAGRGGAGRAGRRSPADRGPAESYERSEQFRATLAALQALPERQRAALVLRELEGRSHEEIAAALGVTKGVRAPAPDARARGDAVGGDGDHAVPAGGAAGGAALRRWRARARAGSTPPQAPERARR